MLCVAKVLSGPCLSWVKLRRTQCEHMFSALPSNSDIARCSRHFAFVPTPDILGAAVVASGRDVNRVVAAHLPPTEPRSRSVILTCYIGWPE